MPPYTNIAKPIESSVAVITTDAVPIGLLITITSVLSTVTSSISGGYANISKPVASVGAWTNISKPT